MPVHTSNSRLGHVLLWFAPTLYFLGLASQAVAQTMDAESQLQAMEHAIPSALRGVALGKVYARSEAVAGWKIDFAYGPAWYEGLQSFREGDFGWIPRVYNHLTSDSGHMLDFASRKAIVGYGFDRVAMAASEPWVSPRGWIRSARSAQRAGRTLDINDGRLVVSDGRQRIELTTNDDHHLTSATVVGPEGQAILRVDYLDWAPMEGGTSHPRRAVESRYRAEGHVDTLEITLTELTPVRATEVPPLRPFPPDTIYLDELRGEMRQAGKVIGAWPPPSGGTGGAAAGSWPSARTITITAGVAFLILAGAIYQVRRRSA